MNKCPRCENENLKEVYNYCPVCGLNLGTAPEVPVQEQLYKRIKSIQYCISVYSVTILICLSILIIKLS